MYPVACQLSFSRPKPFWGLVRPARRCPLPEGREEAAGEEEAKEPEMGWAEQEEDE